MHAAIRILPGYQTALALAGHGIMQESRLVPLKGCGWAARQIESTPRRTNNDVDTPLRIVPFSSQARAGQKK